MTKRKSFVGDNNPLAGVVDSIAPQGKKKQQPKPNVTRRTYGLTKQVCLDLDTLCLQIQQQALNHDEPEIQALPLWKEVLVQVAIEMLCEKLEGGCLPPKIFSRVIAAQQERM